MLDEEAETLVVGMAYLNLKEVKEASKSRTIVPSYRDTLRLQHFEKLRDEDGKLFQVITLNMDIPSSRCRSNRHIEAYVSERGARSFASRYSGTLKYVFGDYIRFPSAYAR